MMKSAGGGFGDIGHLINPEVLNQIAEVLGIQYVPALLFFLPTLVLLILSFYVLIQVSYLHDKLKELVQFTALQNYQQQAKPVLERYEGPRLYQGEDKT